MKISFCCNNFNITKPNSLNSSKKNTVATISQPINQNTNLCSNYAKANILNFKGRLREKEPDLENIKTLVTEQLLDKNDVIHRANISHCEDIVRIKAGKAIEGFANLYDTSKSACAYFDENVNLDKVLMLDHKTKEVTILDCKTLEKTKYNSDDMSALKIYKYHPEDIHGRLRYNNEKIRGYSDEEIDKAINTIENIFSEGKINKSSENITLYRALQSRLSEEELKTLNKEGKIFTEKSFCSTTTDLNVAKRFARYNPILEIDFPKDAEYLDIDKLFNIDGLHWRESEYLLNKNSQFLITGFDNKKKIIKVKYLGSK